jgi:hypothetical protein
VGVTIEAASLPTDFVHVPTLTIEILCADVQCTTTTSAFKYKLKMANPELNATVELPRPSGLGHHLEFIFGFGFGK